MKREITKSSLIDYIKRLDVRCKKFEDEDFDNIIDDSFSELNVFGSYFYDEDVLLVEDYITEGTTKMSYDVERDVSYIYDAFLSNDSKNPHPESDLHVEVDPRIQGRINLDFNSDSDMYNAYTHHRLDSDYDGAFVSLVVRYAYIPTSEFDSIYMNRDVYKALRQAISSCTYIDLHEEEKASIHASRMEKYAKGINFVYPNDFYDKKWLQRFMDGC